MKLREFFATMLILFGLWTIGDWVLSLVNYLDWVRLKSEWYFDLPFRLYTMRFPDWTVPADLAVLSVVAGISLIIIEKSK